MFVRNKNHIKGLFFISIVVLLIANFFVNAIGNRNNLYYVYSIFAIEIIIILLSIINNGFAIRMKKNERNFLIAFVLCQCVTYIVSSVKYNILFFDIHKLFLFVGMVYSCYICSKKAVCTQKTLNDIFDFLILAGLFACVYNLVDNIKYFESGKLSSIMHYSWYLRSFFFTRATYGTFLGVCCIISLLKSERKESIRYLLCYVFFLINIFLTAARAEILATLIASLLYLSYSKRYKKIVIAGIFIVFIGVLIVWHSSINEVVSKFLDTYSMFFDHSKGRDTDLTTGRLYLWQTAISNMNFFSVMFGNGLGSKDTIMQLKNVQVLGETLSSFHSGYVDLFFETGIIGIGFVLYCIVYTFRKVSTNCNAYIKNFLYSLLVLFALVNMADSNMLLFTTDFFAPFATFMIIALPNSVVYGNIKDLYSEEL